MSSFRFCLASKQILLLKKKLSYRFIMNSAIILLISTALGVFAIPTAVSETGLEAVTYLVTLRHSKLFHALQ